MTHWVSFKYPVGSIDEKLTSESSVHASKTPKLIPTDEPSFLIYIFCTAIIWKQVDTGFLHIGLI